MPFLNQALGKDFQFDPILIATSPWGLWLLCLPLIVPTCHILNLLQESGVQFPKKGSLSPFLCHMPKPFGTQPSTGIHCDSVFLLSRDKFTTWNLVSTRKNVMSWIVGQLSWNYQIWLLIHSMLPGFAHRM
jgi:hypothetical protein